MAKVLFIIYNQKLVIILLKELQEMANESKTFVMISSINNESLNC